MSEYISTRGDDLQLQYNDVLLQGLAPDRGLYVPTEYPQVSQQELHDMESMAYPELFVAVKSKFVGDSMTLDEQQLAANRAYTTEKFGAVGDGNYTPVREVGQNIFIQNLSLGPTAAFKDMAMQALAQDLDFELTRRNKNLRILGATSGDTGSSAEAALRGIARVKLFMLSPTEGMSDFQRAQMAELSGDNIHNISVNGPFDDCQDMVKVIKMDPEFSDMGAVNSINWARIASQVPYYFSSYLQTVGADSGQEVDVVVPSGNMGNALSAHVARKMGLPIRTIIVATNENDVLHRLIQTGEYVDNGSQITSSPSMDISKASNYERIAYDMFNNDSDILKDYMDEFEMTGVTSFANVGRADIDLRKRGFDSGVSTHTLRKSVITRLYGQGLGLIDPHTADGLAVAFSRHTPDVPTICMETALPIKFEDIIFDATGTFPRRSARIADIEQALKNDDAFVPLREGVDSLKKYLRANT